MDQAAREYLVCPPGAGALKEVEIEFSRRDPRRETHGWARHEITGCGRVAWCGEVNDRVRCSASQEMELAVAQLEVDNGCAASLVTQSGYVAIGYRHTFRLEGCGRRTYACTVPLEVMERGKCRPILADGEAVVCKVSGWGQPSAEGDQLGAPPALPGP